MKIYIPYLQQVSLINPTLEEAKRLQKIWNSKGGFYTDENTEPAEMTQKAYSARARGNYTPCETIPLNERGTRNYKQYHGTTTEGAVCKVRLFASQNSYRVVVITDKPQKKLPEFVTENVLAV